MRNLLALLAAAMLVAACASAPQTTPIALDAKKVLILAPQGVDPVKDTVGFNTLVKNVTQAFSAAFAEQLAQRGFQTVNVLDQQPTPEMGQKMALYSARHSAGKVAITTLETKTVGADTQLQLRVQFIEGEAATNAVRARTTIEKSYLLRGSQSGDTTLSMADIAKDFADFIQSSGRLANRAH